MIIIMMSLGVLDELPCCICLDILYMMCWFDIPIWLRVFFFLFFFISFLFVLSCIYNSQSVLIRIIIER